MCFVWYKILNKTFENIYRKEIITYINYIIDEDEEYNTNIEEYEQNNNNKKRLNLDSSLNINFIKDKLEEDTYLNIKIDNFQNNIDDHNESKNIISNTKSDNESVNIINKSVGDYGNLLSLFEDLNINEDDNNSNWLNKPFNERIKNREKKNLKNPA